jgi:hypothetical protein
VAAYFLWMGFFFVTGWPPENLTPAELDHRDTLVTWVRALATAGAALAIFAEFARTQRSWKVSAIACVLSLLCFALPAVAFVA